MIYKVRYNHDLHNQLDIPALKPITINIYATCQVSHRQDMSQENYCKA